MTARIVVEEPSGYAVPQLAVLELPIVGATPLVTHRAIGRVREDLAERHRAGEDVHDAYRSEEAYKAGFYRIMDGQPAIPTCFFKVSIMRVACDFGLAMGAVSDLLYISGEKLLEGAIQAASIDGKPRMREDVIRVDGGVYACVCRPEFPQWAVNLTVTFSRALLNPKGVVGLFERAGEQVGVGEMTPWDGGTNGLFRIDPDRPVVYR